MDVPTLEKEQWVFASGREVPLLLATLFPASYQETFTRMGKPEVASAMADGTLALLQEKQVRAFRTRAQLDRASRVFCALVKENGLPALHGAALQEAALAQDNLPALEALSPSTALGFAEAYDAWRTRFARFFPLQVLPHLFEQVLSLSGHQKTVDENAALLQAWRAQTHATALALEHGLLAFLDTLSGALSVEARWLTDAELVRFFENGAKPGLGKRKACFALHWDTAQTPPYTLYEGRVASRMRDALSRVALGEQVLEKALSGRAVCAGRAKGPAFVVREKSDFARIPRGSIVVAHVLELDDLPFVKTQRAGGIVIEEGGVTSHLAIVARELKIPALSGVPHATRAFVTGQTLVLDGENGTVRRA